MEKKENGIPRVGECTPSPDVMPRMGENGGCTNHTCGGDGGMLDDALLAYVYVLSTSTAVTTFWLSTACSRTSTALLLSP